MTVGVLVLVLILQEKLSAGGLGNGDSGGLGPRGLRGQGSSLCTCVAGSVYHEWVLRFAQHLSVPVDPADGASHVTGWPRLLHPASLESIPRDHVVCSLRRTVERALPERVEAFDL